MKWKRNTVFTIIRCWRFLVRANVPGSPLSSFGESRRRVFSVIVIFCQSLACTTDVVVVVVYGHRTIAGDEGRPVDEPPSRPRAVSVRSCVRACVGVRRVPAPGRPAAQAFTAGGLVTSTPAEDVRTRVPYTRPGAHGPPGTSRWPPSSPPFPSGRFSFSHRERMRPRLR